jgi:hypothetical protein
MLCYDLDTSPKGSLGAADIPHQQAAVHSSRHNGAHIDEDSAHHISNLQQTAKALPSTLEDQKVMNMVLLYVL